MAESPRSISWDALEHNHHQKGGDWFFALAIVTVAVVVASIFLGNILFALLVAISGIVVSLSASRPPRMTSYGVSVRGIKVDGTLYPFTTLESYCINEDTPRGTEMLVRSKQHFSALFVLPVPEEYIDDIDDLMIDKLPEEELKEPFLNKILEFFGL